MPIVTAGLLVGLVAFWLLPRPAPPVPAPAETVAEPAAEPTIHPVAAELQSVPVQATEVPRVPSAPTPDLRLVNAQRLREAVFAPFRDVKGTFGIAVKDLATGQSVTLNEYYPFQAASLYKLPVMYEVFKLRDLDFFSLGEGMTVGPDDVAMDLGTLEWTAGTRVSIGTALERMVTISDNASAFMLTKKVGSWRINDDMAAIGLDQTFIRGEDLRTSAADMVRFLEMIARGQAISPDTSAEMVHLMARQQVRDRIPSRLPPQALIANKTGNWESAAHDVAIIYGPRSTVVIAFLSDGIGDINDLYRAMGTAARNVYDLVNDPSFGSSQEPAIPRNEVSTYGGPVRAAGAGNNGASTSRTPASSSTAPAEKPRATTPVTAPSTAPSTGSSSGTGAAPRPTAAAPAPAAPAVVTNPAPKPASKPAEKPQGQPPPPDTGAPVVKPQAPSLFAPAPAVKPP